VYGAFTRFPVGKHSGGHGQRAVVRSLQREPDDDGPVAGSKSQIKSQTKTKGRYQAAEGWERCRVRVRAWCTIEMTSAMLIGTASAVAMFIPAMCLVVEMPSK
jgi:hypothetical protein